MQKYPYRFRAEDGMYAGTTFVYFEDGTVITYVTRCPETYFVTFPGVPLESRQFAMTPGDLARLEKIEPSPRT